MTSRKAKGRTEVHFRSEAFNCAEPKDYFINDCCFGDDVCRWLIDRLRARGFRTADQPDQEDFGWYFTFHEGDAEHCFVVGLSAGDTPGETFWRGWLERHRGFFGSVFGGRERGISLAACDAIHDALASSEKVHSISWHFPDDPEDELIGAPRPSVPSETR